MDAVAALALQYVVGEHDLRDCPCPAEGAGADRNGCGCGVEKTGISNRQSGIIDERDRMVIAEIRRQINVRPESVNENTTSFPSERINGDGSVMT